MSNTIVWQPGDHGGRLTYFRSSVAGADHWDDLWETEQTRLDYAPRLKGELPREIRPLFEKWAPKRGRVLEAGCGLGGLTVALHARGYDAEGVDYAPRVIDMLKHRFPQIPFRTGDVRHLVGTPDGLYDIVYSPGVCEHDEEGPEAILREAIRVTKRGGIVIVSAPCLNQLRRLAARLGGFSKRASGGIFYQYAFSQTELASILESLGCEHLETRTYGTLRSIYDLLPISGRVHEATLRKHTTDALRTNPSRLGQLVDALPVARDWGHSGVWIARKC